LAFSIFLASPVDLKGLTKLYGSELSFPPREDDRDWSKYLLRVQDWSPMMAFHAVARLRSTSRQNRDFGSLACSSVAKFADRRVQPVIFDD
jgi:hypothetical protein